jgi:hypothetical protein
MKATGESIGAVAVRLGYCNPDDIHYALAVQQEEGQVGGPVRPIGMILLESGLIDSDELIHILKYLQRRRPAERDSVGPRTET